MYMRLMDEFIKMDIFFMIASVGTVVVTTITVLIGIKLFRILKDVERIAKNVSEEVDGVREDIDRARERIARLIK